MWSPGFFLIVFIAALDMAAPDEQTWRFDVPRQARNMRLLVAKEATRGLTTNRARGAYSLEIGLTILLRGSGLTWLRTGQIVYSLVVSNGSIAK